jgi:LAO/AO transport system kinase
MQRHAKDTDVFIKSIATRGHVGGLSRSAFGLSTVMDAMGKDVVIIETVGVGQDEVDITSLAHTTVVVITPDMGDGMQAVKSGLLETADVFVLNKSDLHGSESTLDDLNMMLTMRQGKKHSWNPPVVKTMALGGQGVDELLQHIHSHHIWLREEGGLADFQQQKAHTHLMIHFRHLLLDHAVSSLTIGEQWQHMIARILERDIDPHSAAAELAEQVLRK